MRYILRIGFALALGLVLMAGCSDESGEGGSGGTGAVGGGGTGGTGGRSTIAKILLVQGYSHETGFLGPVSGVKICALDTDDCVRTNDAGRAVVQVPIDDEYGFTLEKEGYGSELWFDSHVPEGLRLSPEDGLVEEEYHMNGYARVGSPYPMQGTGTVVVFPLDSWLTSISTGPVGVAGRKFVLTNAEGKSYYHDEEGRWDATLTATSRWGWGGFTEVPPGEVEIKIESGAERCVVLHGWPGTLENSVRLPVRAGFDTQVWVNCRPPCDTLGNPPPGCHDSCLGGSDSECEPGTFCFYGTCEAQCTADEGCTTYFTECNERGMCRHTLF